MSKEKIIELVHNGGDIEAYLNAVRADVIVEAASRIAAQAWEEDEGPGIVAAVDALEIIEREFRAGNAGKDGV
ncbi:hypothetical protein QM327_16660 [Pantoea dispersa]|uniref:hypothetical protein n=1 Tax=Pantoea dispersa TaxID=59814 RepID=UPI0024B670EE|nr:hypothetical protein [Pantoea dispersa]MDI9768185.1 hypothetical protein [Pantoea dispersa]